MQKYIYSKYPPKHQPTVPEAIGLLFLSLPSSNISTFTQSSVLSSIYSIFPNSSTLTFVPLFIVVIILLVLISVSRNLKFSDTTII